ncbi:beta-xylosidase [Haloechinothrix salitolerans]|uniref:Beta-xylosidase n=1 Tax=Haloechinothrix salitolerans TaxID=926830 RepID=A0ABW2C477_9PSEU
MSRGSRIGAARRPAVRVPGLALLLAITFVVTGCTTVRGEWTGPDTRSSSPTKAPDVGSPTEPAVRLDLERRPGGSRVKAASRNPATDHGATLLRDGKRTRLWWCGRNRDPKLARRGGRLSRSGTVILHASARTLEGRFTSTGRAKRGEKRGKPPRVALAGSKGGFDAAHTCDPSVIKVDGVYYLYYTGTRGKSDAGNAIGLATSKNGVRWRRANGGKPIVRPARPKRNGYGAGRPAVVHLDGWFYLLFTDSTAGEGGNRGQFLLRSRDPAFRERVQALGERGFRTVHGTGAPRTWSIADAADADLMWVDLLDAFAVVHRTETGTMLTFWDRGFSGHPYPRVTVRASSKDGPGLLRTPSGHAPRSELDPCERVPVDMVRATRGRPKRTAFRHVGVDLVGARGCLARADAVRLLEGHAFPSPEHTMDLIVDGELLRVERRSVATILATEGTLAQRPHLPELDVTARLNSGAPVLRSRDGQTGLLLDDGRLWPLREPALAKRIARRNESHVRTVGDIAWGAYPVASVLG